MYGIRVTWCQMRPRFRTTVASFSRFLRCGRARPVRALRGSILTRASQRQPVSPMPANAVDAGGIPAECAQRTRATRQSALQ